MKEFRGWRRMRWCRLMYRSLDERMLGERLVSEELLGIRNGLNLDHVGLRGEEEGGVLFRE